MPSQPQAVPQTSFEDFSGGILDDLAVADALVPRNCVRKGINVMFNRPRGGIAQRLGTVSVGSGVLSGANTVRGLHNLRTNVSGVNVLYGAVNGRILAWNGSSWSEEVSGLTASKKVRFLTYLDQAVALNGTEGARWTAGTGSWSTTGGSMDVGNFPLTKVAMILNGRVFALGNDTNPDTLYKSSIVSAGAVSWTSGNGTVQIKPNDGAGRLVSGIANGRMLLLFKDRGMYRYDDNSLEFVDATGTPSHESVVLNDGVVYFFGQQATGTGFYATSGGFPKKLSRGIQKWVEAIPASFYENVAGYTDGDKVVWSVGAATIGENTYANVHLVFNTADQTWEVRNYPDSFRVFSHYINSSGRLTVVGGDTDGFVQTMDSGYTDGAVGSTPGTDIFTECELAPFVITRREEQKLVSKIAAFCRDQQGVDFYLGADGGDFRKVGSLTGRETVIDAPEALRGHTFYPKIVGANSGPPFLFEGFSVVEFVNEGVI